MKKIILIWQRIGMHFFFRMTNNWYRCHMDCLHWCRSLNNLYRFSTLKNFYPIQSCSSQDIDVKREEIKCVRHCLFRIDLIQPKNDCIRAKLWLNNTFERFFFCVKIPGKLLLLHLAPFSLQKQIKYICIVQAK